MNEALVVAMLKWINVRQLLLGQLFIELKYAKNLWQDMMLLQKEHF